MTEKNIVLDETNLSIDGPITKMIKNGTLSINNVQNKEHILEENALIDSWEKSKHLLLNNAEALVSNFDKTEQAVRFLLENDFAGDEPYVEVYVNSDLRDKYPEFESISTYFLNLYHQDYNDWCKGGDFRLYVLGHMISEDFFEDEATLIGAAYIYALETKSFQESIDYALSVGKYEIKIREKINSIVAIEGIIKRA